MKNSILYIFLSSLLMICDIVLTSCKDDLAIVNNNKDVLDGEVVISGSLFIPELASVSTRDMDDDMAEDLYLTIFEFDKGIDATSSFLTNTYQAEIVETSADGEVKFKFSAQPSTTPKVFHLTLYWPEETEYETIATVIPSLISRIWEVGEVDPAYWGSTKCDEGIVKTDSEGNTMLNVGNAFTKIPMIRNYAKFSISKVPDNFELKGFEMINVPVIGTIIPWDQNTLSIPQLLNGNSMLPFSSLSYKGYSPGESFLMNDEEDTGFTDSYDSEWMNSEDKYILERPYTPDKRTYIIIYGNFISGDVLTPGYYKVDIGYLDKGEFKYYNIIRNYNYDIKINSVQAAGYKTFTQALKGIPSNNLSAAIETEGMLNLSNGTNYLSINQSDYLIVDKDYKFTVLYRYIQNYGKENESNGNKIAHPEGLSTGPVIKEFEESNQVFVDENGSEWKQIFITCNNPSDVVKRQSFSIVDDTGLVRTINMTLRNPYRYAYLPTQSGSNSTSKVVVSRNQSRSIPYNNQGQPESQTIGDQAKQPLTLFFCLPAGMSESMFPLDFRIESKYQGIENNPLDEMTVYTGPSLFDPEVYSLSYFKTVTYEEYQYLYDDSNQLNEDMPNTSHQIACRFLTISKVDDGTEGEIMIQNEYFKPNLSVTFTRSSMM